MQKTLQLKPHPLILEAFSVTTTSLLRPSNVSSAFNQYSSPLLSLSHTQNPILCARNNKRRFGSQRSRKIMLELVDFLASNLNILPGPLGFVIREFGGGNGGGLGFFRGFGGEGFDGWRRKRKKNLCFVGFFMVCGLGLWLMLGKGMDSDVFWGGLCLFLFGVLINGWKRWTKDWVLGFCFGAVLVGVRLKREDFQKWAKSGRALDIVGRRKRRRAMLKGEDLQKWARRRN